MAGDIWGDGISLVPHTLTASMDGTVVSVPPATLLAGMDGMVAAVPPYTISAAGTFLDYMVGTLPIYTITSVVIAGALLSADDDLPAYTATGTLVTGEMLSALNELPAHSLVADFGWFANNDLPAYTLNGLVRAGEIMVGDLELPTYTLNASLLSAGTMAGASTLPAYLIAATLLPGGVGQAALLLPAHEITATGFSGSVLNAANNLPLYVLVSDAFAAYTLTGANTLPMYQLTARMTSAITAAFRAWALNLRTQAMTEYTNFSFNSFAAYNGKLYAAGPAGVFEVGTQDTDANTGIDASLRTGKHNFGTTFGKRVPRIYLGHHTVGDLEFRTMTGEGGTRAYLLPWNNVTDLQQRRVPVGRGPKSVYWQFEVANRAGADFDLDNMQFYPEVSKRRVAP
jgi:hypothetical protein